MHESRFWWFMYCVLTEKCNMKSLRRFQEICAKFNKTCNLIYTLIFLLSLMDCEFEDICEVSLAKTITFSYNI